MLVSVVRAVMAMPSWAVYAVVAALAFGESAAFVGLVLSGETALLLGGVVAAGGRISLPVMIIAAVAAAIAGDLVGYEIGRLGAHALRRGRAGRFVGGKRWNQAETFMTRHGSWAVFSGRWIGLMRALVPALAAMSRMPYRRFLVFNAACGAAWATAVVLGGYLAGASWQRVQSYVGHASVMLGVVIVGVVAAAATGRWLTRRRVEA